jgi:hypothetical protein
MKRQALYVVLFLLLSQETCRADDIETALRENNLVLITDFDQTLTGDSWKTLWYLKKIPYLQTYFQQATLTTQTNGTSFDELPAELPITEKEFLDFFRHKMAVSENNGQLTPGSYKPVLLEPIFGFAERSRALKVFPGFYTVSFDSFRNFRTVPGRSLLLEDNEVGRQLEVGGRGSRFGVSFPLFQELMRDANTVENIHVVTARSQSEAEFLELFKAWQREGLLETNETESRKGKKVVNKSVNIHPMGQGEGLLYGFRINQRKVRLVQEQIINHYRLQAMQKESHYTLVIAENDPDTVRDYFRMLTEISSISDYKKHLTFILIHAGTPEEVQRSEMPSRMTTFKNGLPVALDAKTERLLTDPKTVKPQVVRGSCKSVFVRLP